MTRIFPDEWAGAASTSALVVTQNPDSADDARIIRSLSEDTPVVVHVHCRYSYYDESQRRNLDQCVERATVGITPARFATLDMGARYPRVSWQTVSNGIDTARFRPTVATERAGWRRERDIPPTAFLVAFVGRLESAKGVEILEKFCGLVGGSNIHVLVQFLAAGDDASTARHRERVERLQATGRGHVHLFVDADPSSARPVRHCDALLTSSLSEVCPMVVLEALHCGVPVFGTRATPFYDELAGFRIPQGTCQFVDLPADVDTSRPRRELRVPAAAATDVARRLVGIASSLHASSDDERRAVSTLVARAGFTEQAMFDRLRAIYDGLSLEGRPP